MLFKLVRCLEELVGAALAATLPQMLFNFVGCLEELVGAALAATLMPGSLARLNLEQNIVAQLLSLLMIDIRDTHAA